MIYSRIPVIGGKELDLHVLYVEVTRRGGYEKVNHFTSWFFFNTTSSLFSVLNLCFQNACEL